MSNYIKGNLGDGEVIISLEVYAQVTNGSELFSGADHVSLTNWRHGGGFVDRHGGAFMM